jgi:uncharacterized membrane-anchored protein
MKTKLLCAVIALQAAWIVGTVAVQELRFHLGAVVLLETAPVDPRDLLRGDYVILNYKISNLPASLFTGGLGTNQHPQGTTVYVKLEKRGQFFEVQEASLQPIESDDAHPVLRGQISHDRWWGPNQTTVNVDYGLERYYVSEGTGNPTGKLTVEAAVPSSGRAVIRQVYIDGKPYAEAMKSQAQ